LENTARYVEIEIRGIFEKLQVLSHDPDVVRINIPLIHSKYEKVLRQLPNYIGNIGRVDEKGILRYTFPYDAKAIGRDVSYQKHNIRFLLHRKPQVSSVFKAVQGYDAVALIYPVFDSKGEFKGGVSCLIDVKKMFWHFSELTKAGLDEFFVASLSDSSILFAGNLDFIGRNFYDVLNELVRSDVKWQIKSTFDSISYGGFALKGRHKWGRKINLAFSFAKIEPLREDTEKWVAVNLIDEQSLLYRFSYVFILLGILVASAMIIFLYLLYVYFSSIRYSFQLEDELDKQAWEIIESERRYRELSDNPIVGLAIYDENGFIFFNRRLPEILGYDVESFKNLKPSDFIHPDDRDEFIKGFRQVLNGEIASRKSLFRAIRKDGGIIYLVCHSKRIIHEGKPVIQTVIFDVTKEKIQEDIIKHLQRVESIGTFTMGMAHDFNNILQIIVTSAQMMDIKISSGKVSKDELKKYIDNIISISNRGAELIKRLKIFVRREIPSAEVFKFDEVVLTTAEILRAVFPKFIELEVKANTGNVKIYGSKIEIQQALLNIAVNAKDAIVEKIEKGVKDYRGKVVIETCIKDVSTEEAETLKVNPGKYVCVAVVDNGIGMDEKTKSRIFDPFFTTKKPEIGTGLGMSTVFGIISSHGGFINVDSKLGEGTRVEFYLPVAEVEETVPVVEEEVDSKKKEVKSAIMIISEDVGLKTKLKSIFESLGFGFLFPGDKVVAVKMLKENFDKVDLIFIDARKPRLDLRTTVAELKILKPKVKIILLYPAPEDEDIDGVEIIRNPDVELENLLKLTKINVR
jgi:PAS domain S-box-containing protein